MARTVHTAAEDTTHSVASRPNGGTTSAAASGAAPRAHAAGDTPASDDPLGLDALSSARRLELELAARRSADSDEALERVIALLLPGSSVRQQAVVRAFREHDKLRLQWQNAYEKLIS